MSSAPSDSTKASPSKRQTFMVRLGSTLVLWALFAISLSLKLDIIIFLIVATLASLSTWEYFKLQGERLDRRYMNLTLGLTVAYWALVGWFSVKSGSEHPEWLDTAGITSVFLGAFLIVFAKPLEGEKSLLGVFSAIFGFVYTTWMAGFLSRLVFFNGTDHGAYLLLAVSLVTKFGDMSAYATGTAFGKKKMIPHISPGKSWVGFYGAFAGSIGGMALMMWLFGDKLQPLTWTHAMILAPILCLVGIIGDLAESVLKRCYQIKDTGHTLPGIGGVLDLTDSLLFVAPVAYLYLRYIA